MARSMPTVANGIEFRSRTEASWFLFFKRLGLSPIYEPGHYEVSDINGKSSCNYLPDLSICGEYLVEVKASVVGETEDIAKACILGYTHPTIVVIGWPLEYAATLVNERRKGSPDGFRVSFTRGRVVMKEDIYLSTSYPDENWLDMSDSDIQLLGQRELVDDSLQRLAAECWNATKWKR